MLRRGLMKFVDREPVAAVSLGLGLFGFSLPFIVPPIRQSMGLCTKQVNLLASVQHSTTGRIVRGDLFARSLRFFLASKGRFVFF